MAQALCLIQSLGRNGGDFAGMLLNRAEKETNPWEETIELRSKDGRVRPSLHNLFRDAVLLVLRAEDAVDGVGGAATGFVVVADLHFAQQANSEKI
jgi:hypothetical protein